MITIYYNITLNRHFGDMVEISNNIGLFKLSSVETYYSNKHTKSSSTVI